MFFMMSLTAVTILDATPFQIGMLMAMHGLSAIFGLFMGAWLDRRRRVPIIVAADIGRFLLLLVIPIGFITDSLSMNMIYVIAFGIATMGVMFQIAYRTLLPSVVKRDDLLEANSKLEIATAGSVAIGPSFGGALVQVMVAPFALLAGAASFAVSAIFFSRMKVDERLETRKDSVGAIAEIREGLKYFRPNRHLVGLAVSGTSLQFFLHVYAANSLIYLVKQLEIDFGLIGIMFAFSSIGLVLGSIVASRYSERIGVGRSMTAGLVLAGLGYLVFPTVTGPVLVIIPIFITGAIALETGIVVYSVQQVSLRQTITPYRLHARINSIFLMVTRLAIPVGALLGGLLGETIGVRNTLFVAAIGVGSSAI